MTKDQATQAVELLGGLAKAARLVTNARGEPMRPNNLSKAISAPRGVPDWLSEQLTQAVSKHKDDCERWLKP